MLFIKPMMLIALGVGYFVLRAAYSEKKELKRVGVILGWAIILFSIVSIFTCATACYKGSGKGYFCPYKKGAPTSVDAGAGSGR